MEMNYKYPFFILITGMVVASILPFGMSQTPEDAFMEIDMLVGQTEYPFRIQDTFDQNVFAVKPNGGLDPIITEYNEVILTQELYSEWFPTWLAVSPMTTAPSAETGAGVYQIEYIITASDVDASVDSAGMWTSEEFIPAITWQFQNLDTGSIGSGMSFFINDVEFGRDTVTISNSNYGRGIHDDRGIHDGRNGNVPFAQVGDVIGIKMWQSSGVADSLRLNHLWMIGQPKFTTVAVFWSIGDMDWSLNPIKISPVIPAIFSGETFASWGECITPYFHDYWQCIGDNSDFAGAGGGIGTIFMQHTQDGTSLSNTSSSDWIILDLLALRQDAEINVVTWK